MSMHQRPVGPGRRGGACRIGDPHGSGSISVARSRTGAFAKRNCCAARLSLERRGWEEGVRAGDAHVQLRRRGNSCLRGVSRASQERRAALWVLEIERRDLKGGGGGESSGAAAAISIRLQHIQLFFVAA